MAKRPLESLVLNGWGQSPASKKFVFSKPLGDTKVVFIDWYGTQYNEAEARQLHAWLGELLIDLNHGV